ncbi:DUF5911 domain-containing protein [Streptomyces radiopugnans]|nr:DUF5911 domain-containing protein [Streptomyces radiopugnans]
MGYDGSVDWLCLPRFDSEACFAALLGRPEHGRWLLAPRDRARPLARRYRGDSAVLETEYAKPRRPGPGDRLHARRRRPPLGGTRRRGPGGAGADAFADAPVLRLRQHPGVAAARGAQTARLRGAGRGRPRLRCGLHRGERRLHRGLLRRRGREGGLPAGLERAAPRGAGAAGHRRAGPDRGRHRAVVAGVGLTTAPTPASTARRWCAP